MSTYIPMLIWLMSAGICAWIARARQVKPGFLWNIIVVILGPVAIPLMLLAKPQAA